MQISLELLLGAVLLATACAFQFTSQSASQRISRLAASVGGQQWNEIEMLRQKAWDKATMPHLGDHVDQNLKDGLDAKHRAEYNLRVGTAIETLKHQLPLLFYISNMDYSIFANLITLADGNQNKIVVQRSFYKAGVSSLRMAASLSSIYPSLNLKKVEYIEDCRTIQCLVDIVLPDNVKLDGQTMWQGYLYYGLNAEGLIDTLIFDRKIPPLKPSQLLNAKEYPWFQPQPARWHPELITARSAQTSSEEPKGDFYENILQ